MAVVTTFSPKGYEVYGRKMIESFAKYWPEALPFYVFHEGKKPKDASERAIWKSLDEDKTRTAFFESYKHKRDDPSDYRFRAKCYSNKVFAQAATPRGDYIIWLDGDTVTENTVTPRDIERLLPPGDKIAAYLARPYFRHTETGFIAFNHTPDAGRFLDEMRDTYVSGLVYDLPEQHDCAVFDFSRIRFERAGHRFHNLCPNAIGLHVFEQSPLAHIIRHNKGPVRQRRAYGEVAIHEAI